MKDPYLHFCLKPICWTWHLFVNIFIPSGLCFSEFHNGWRVNPLLLLVVWLWANYVLHVPGAWEGTMHRLVYSVILSLNKASSGLGNSRLCGLGLWDFMKLHITFGSNDAGEAVWVMLQNRLIIYSNSASVNYSCKLLLHQAKSSPSTYIHVNKLEQEYKELGTPGLVYSQRNSPPSQSRCLLAAKKQDMSLI